MTGTSLISQLQEKKAQLETALAKAVTEKEYDLLDEELRQTNKTLTLAENQERQRQEAEAKAARKKALDEFEKERNRIKGVLEKASLMDKIIFDEMTTVYYKFQEAFEMRLQAAKDTNDLQIKARELEIDQPEAIPITMCGTRPGATGGVEEYFVNFVQQFDLAARALKGAQKNKVPGAPKRPGLDWFFKGHGEFYPRDPEPPIPPKEFYSRKAAGKNG